MSLNNQDANEQRTIDILVHDCNEVDYYKYMKHLLPCKDETIYKWPVSPTILSVIDKRESIIRVYNCSHIPSPKPNMIIKKGQIKYFNFYDTPKNNTMETLECISNDSLEYDAINSPIIAIMGFGYSNSKFLIQCELSLFLKSQDITFYNITYNQTGSILGYDVIPYPDKIDFEKETAIIGQYLYHISSNKNPNCIIINIGGGIERINRKKTNFYGGLHFAFLEAAKIDYCVLCCNTSIKIDRVIYQARFLKAKGIGRVVVFISSYCYDSSNVSTSDWPSVYKADNSRIEQYRLELMKHDKTIRVFTNSDFTIQNALGIDVLTNLS